MHETTEQTTLFMYYRSLSVHYSGDSLPYITGTFLMDATWFGGRV